MRKALLAASALCGAAFVVPAASAQQAPQVRIGGYFEFNAMHVSDNADKGRDRSAVDFRQDAEIHVLVSGKAANGLSYGATIELQMDNVGAGPAGTAVDTDEAYGWVSHERFGTVRFGDEDNAANLMQVRAPSVALFGPDGSWDEGLAGASGATLAPSLMTSMNNGNDATKIVYLSPQFYGFDFGVSFAPNGSEGERTAVGLENQRNRTGIRNEMSAAVRYRSSFSGVALSAGAGAQQAEVPAVAGMRDRVTAYNAGLTLTYAGFAVGGEYVFGNYSGISVGRAALAQDRDASHHWVLGASYTTGPVVLGAYYGAATQDLGAVDRKQRVIGVGAQYGLAPGLDLVASYNNLRDENGPVATPNGAARSADVFMLSTRLAF